MSAYSTLSSLFDTPMPKKPTLLESLSSRNQIKLEKPMEPPTYTEIFGELHFQENPKSASDPTPQLYFSEFDVKKGLNSDDPSSDSLPPKPRDQNRGEPKSNGGFSPKNSEFLHLCTEGLGSESSDDVEDLVNETDVDDWKSDDVKAKEGGNGYAMSYTDVRRRSGGGGFPPPISSIGRNGKPGVCFKSYREGGRFVLREIRIPEFLRASREDGRLKLHFVHPDIDSGEEEEEVKQMQG